ncbi:MAG: class I SAM-dependent methyltransferase [Anaerolineae bacterium]
MTVISNENLHSYTQSNRAAWNEVMPLHQMAAREKWDRAFAQPGYVCLDELEVGLFRQIGVAGKAAAQLCCNNGVELLSIKNLGAGECVGFDISDEAIREAQERADVCQIGCHFVRTDVYDIGAEYGNRFDVLYLSAGALGWLPDLPRLFTIAAGLLRENGCVLIHEIHPVAEMLPFDDYAGEDVQRIIEPYFKTEPYIEFGGLDYVGKSQYNSTIPQYWFVHTLADILMGVVQAGLRLEHFAEYPTDISAGHKRVEQAQAGIPLSYTLIARKMSAG